MKEDDNQPEAVEVENTEVEAPSQEPSPSGDPFDLIEDPTVRGEAKKYRSIAQRKASKPETKVETPAPQPTTLTRDDLVRINAKTAKELVDAPIQEHWSELIDYIPPKYRNAETPAEIAQGMKLAYVAYQAEHPEKATSNPAADLQTTPSVKRTSGAPTATGERQTQPILRKTTSMTDWYPKPQK